MTNRGKIVFDTEDSLDAVACANGCSDAGECMSLKSLSQVYAVETEAAYEQMWDAEMIYGCKCSKGRHGFDCSKREEPLLFAVCYCAAILALGKPTHTSLMVVVSASPSITQARALAATIRSLADR